MYYINVSIPSYKQDKNFLCTILWYFEAYHYELASAVESDKNLQLHLRMPVRTKYFFTGVIDSLGKLQTLF